MATDFYPDPPVDFADLVAVVAAAPFETLADPPWRDGAVGGLVLTVDGRNHVHAGRLKGGGVVISRYGANDPEPVLKALEAVLATRFGPEHLRDDS